jgi:hypothetical protein
MVGASVRATPGRANLVRRPPTVAALVVKMIWSVVSVRGRTQTSILEYSMCAVPGSRTSRAGSAECASTQVDFAFPTAVALAGAGAASCGEQQIRLSGSGKIQEIVARALQAADMSSRRFQLPNGKHRLARASRLPRRNKRKECKRERTDAAIRRGAPACGRSSDFS